MQKISTSLVVLSLIVSLLTALPGCGDSTTPHPTAAAPERLEFTRMIVHWTRYVEPGYLEFVEEAEPEIAQVGFYGGEFWTLAHMPDDVKGLTGPAAAHSCRRGAGGRSRRAA